MWSSVAVPALVSSLTLAGSGCAAPSDPPRPAAPAPEISAAPSAAATASTQRPGAGVPIGARDVAILVVEQAPASLRVVSSARRSRSSFGPAASWNGTGTPTHRWALRDAKGEPLASGDIVARAAIELPPSAKMGHGAVSAPRGTFAFDVRVPQPEAGEVIEISPIAAPTLTARWP